MKRPTRRQALFDIAIAIAVTTVFGAIGWIRPETVLGLFGG